MHRAATWDGLLGSEVTMTARIPIVLAVTAAMCGHAMAASPTSYLCVVDQVTGFSFKNGEWVETSFQSGDKYLFKEITTDNDGPDWKAGDAVWTMTPIGSDFSIARCSDWIYGVGLRERMS